MVAQAKRPLGDALKALQQVNDATAERKAKLAELEAKQKSLNERPDYRGRGPGALFGQTQAPRAITGERGERPYSFLKAAQFSRGIIGADQAKEECQISEKLKSLYEGMGFISGNTTTAPTIMIPTATRFMPFYGSTAAEKLVYEIREKTLFNTGAVDRDEVNYLRQKALGTFDDTAGGTWVAPPMMGEFIDMQRIQECWVRAGASEVGFTPNGRMIMPKLSGGATPYWVPEAGPISEGQQTTGDLTLEAKTLGVLIRLNNQFLKFATPGSEALVRSDMARQAALLFDATCYGWGPQGGGHPNFGVVGFGGTQVKGIVTYATSTSWTMGTDKVLLHTASTTGNDGNTYGPQDFTKQMNLLPDEVEPTAWIMRRNMYGILTSRRADAVSASDGAGVFVVQQFLTDFTGRQVENIKGLPVIYSSNVPNNVVKGSGTALTEVLTGNFKEWIIARAGIMEMLVNPYSDTAMTQNQTLLRCIQYLDAGPRHLASFCRCTSLLQS